MKKREKGEKEREKREKREKKRGKEREKKRENREKEREKCPGSTFINLHSIFKINILAEMLEISKSGCADVL